jgi:hypothetical protein
MMQRGIEHLRFCGLIYVGIIRDPYPVYGAVEHTVKSIYLLPRADKGGIKCVHRVEYAQHLCISEIAAVGAEVKMRGVG